MAMVDLTLESIYLQGCTQVSVFLPDCPRNLAPEEFYGSGKKYKVLWLLHGTYGDHSDFVRRTMLEVYARERQLICVMPSGLNSDYTNWSGFAGGFDMWRYLLDELMPMIHSWFPASDKKEDNFITGLSMGGMGTMKYLLNNTDKFASGCIMSFAPINYDAMDENNLGLFSDIRRQNQIANQGGFEAFKNSNENSWRQILEMHEKGTLPPMLFTIGTEDFLYDSCYLPFKKMCLEKGISVTFDEVPGYGHEWRFWDQALEKAMDFFGVTKDNNANAWRGLKTEANFFVKK